jgi:hypothetical protein
VTLEQLTSELTRLDETELEEVARYISYLRFRSRLHASPALSESELAAMYAQAADEDRDLAEAGLADYAASLAVEDVR